MAGPWRWQDQPDTGYEAFAHFQTVDEVIARTDVAERQGPGAAAASLALTPIAAKWRGDVARRSEDAA
jgi:hypothetical protein